MDAVKFLKRIVRKLEYRQDLREKKKVITKNFKDLEHHRKLTKSQKKEVQDYYHGLIGHNVPLYSHEYFYSRTGFFTKEYVPTNLYHCDLIRKANYYPFMYAYSDKNMQDIILEKENTVHAILKNINGYYYYEGKPVSEEEAIMNCRNISKAILKPTLRSKGNGVKAISVKDGMTNIDGLTIGQLFKKYKKNFIIQECIKQHELMSALNPTSVNTIRVLSYRSGMEVLIIYSVVRIGRKGQVVDNQSAGGISTTISEDGRLGKEAFGGYNKDNILKTDTGIVLEGYQLPSYDKAIDMVKRLHMKLPYANIVGWDIAIQEDGEPVLIEFNTNTGLSQSAMKSGMGKYTERIIKELWPRPNSKY